MTTKEAVQNINNVLALGRIVMPSGPLNRQEHGVLQQNLKFLEQRANKADELETQNKTEE